MSEKPGLKAYVGAGLDIRIQYAAYQQAQAWHDILGRLLIAQWQALGATSAGLGFFAALYSFASWVDKPSKVPFVSLPATSSVLCLTAEQCRSMHQTCRLCCLFVTDHGDHDDISRVTSGSEAFDHCTAGAKGVPI